MKKIFEKIDKKYIIISIVIFILILTLLILFLPPNIKIKSHETLYGIAYTPKYKVTRFGIDYTKKTKVTNKVKKNKLGTYKVIYKTKIGFMTFTKVDKVKVVDKTKPIITIKGAKETYICPNAEYKDEGATAIDNIDGDLTKKIKVIRKETAKDKYIIYEVKDKSKNKTKVKRKLIYDDITKPEIVIIGSNPLTYYMGDNFTDPGVKVTDNCDGDITKNTTITNQVNINKEGIYKITYTAKDKKSNETTITREVKVLPASQKEKNGVIYLTFDDGPNEGTTNVILDILKEEGVKATFFVTRRGPDSLIKREYDEGHTVALHTYTHDYQTCYSSVEGYFNDLNQISNRVKNITGYEAKIIRFPGGSSNTVSKKYNQGIMTKLTDEVAKRGYHYFDWNISSGDAGETTNPTGVYNNVVSRLRKNQSNIILMHDIKTYTRDAIRDIIKYGKNNGYSFDRITMDTKEYHQKVNN